MKKEKNLTNVYLFITANITVLLMLSFLAGCSKEKSYEPEEQEPGIYQVGEYHTMKTIYDLYVANNITYLVDGDGLIVINTSKPEQPTFESNISTPGFASGIFILDNYAYVADGSEGLQIVDVLDSANPSLIGNFNTPDSAVNVYIQDNYAFVADYGSGLIIVDVSDPSQPESVSTYLSTGNARDVSVSNDYAYLVDSAVDLVIVDISDPTQPTLETNFSLQMTSSNIFIYNDYIFVAASHQIHIIDVYNPSNPRLAGSLSIGSMNMDNRGIFTSGNYAYLASSNGLDIIDVTNLANPVLADYMILSAAYDVYVYNDYIYLANSTPGLQIFTFVPGALELGEE